MKLNKLLLILLIIIIVCCVLVGAVLLTIDNDSEEVFIGRDFGHTSRGYGEKVAGTIDEEVKRIIDECYAKARRIIQEHHDVLDKCAKLLLEKEKITRSEFEALFDEDSETKGA